MAEQYRNFEFKYGLLIIRTRRFQGIMDKLGTWKITPRLGWLMLYIMPVAAGIALFLFLLQLSVLFSPQGQNVAQYIRTLTPLANLLLPGINPYLPLIYGWIAIFIAMITHEGAHGIVARSLNLPVKSAGLLFFLILPVGAFVEVDDKELKKVRARDSGRVLAAGAGINFIIAVFCLLLLFASVSTMKPAVNGMAVISVYKDEQQISPAYIAGIRPGDFIIAVNGESINDPSAVLNSSWYKPGNRINITVWRNGEILQLNATLSSITVIDTRTNKTYVRAFLGVQDIGYDELNYKVKNYLNSFSHSPLAYLCIPTLPRCQDFVPFSDTYSSFYKSSLGGIFPILINLLYWIYFVNFNVAIFNSLPIYPLDGGQAFEIAVRSIGKGRMSEVVMNKITRLTTALVLSIIIFLIFGPYLIL